MRVFTKSWIINLCKKRSGASLEEAKYFLYVTEDNKAVFIDIYDKQDGWQVGEADPPLLPQVSKHGEFNKVFYFLSSVIKA